MMNQRTTQRSATTSCAEQTTTEGATAATTRGLMVKFWSPCPHECRLDKLVFEVNRTKILESISLAARHFHFEERSNQVNLLVPLGLHGKFSYITIL